MCGEGQLIQPLPAWLAARLDAITVKCSGCGHTIEAGSQPARCQLWAFCKCEGRCVIERAEVDA